MRPTCNVSLCSHLVWNIYDFYWIYCIKHTIAYWVDNWKFVDKFSSCRHTSVKKSYQNRVFGFVNVRSLYLFNIYWLFKTFVTEDTRKEREKVSKQKIIEMRPCLLLKIKRVQFSPWTGPANNLIRCGVILRCINWSEMCRFFKNFAVRKSC